MRATGEQQEHDRGERQPGSVGRRSAWNCQRTGEAARAGVLGFTVRAARQRRLFQPPPVPRYGSKRPYDSTPNQNTSDNTPTALASAGVGSFGPSLRICGSTFVK